MTWRVAKLSARKPSSGKDALAEIDSTGVQVKDIDIGLLDFPCQVEGRTLLLCWKLGEKGITHWHSTSEGFAGRKPIDSENLQSKKNELVVCLQSSVFS